MKKTLPIIVVCSIILIIIPIIVSAAGIELKSPLDCGGKECTIPDIINAIAKFIAMVGSGVAVIMIIWGGIQYMTAGSNEQRVSNAKKTIQWAIIGVAILWSADFLIRLVAWVLGKQT